MLINLKVKTLDAQTHEFSIDNEITVREFKDKVAEKTNIAADQQRFIYCGRVMVDDKQLKDYDVDGKVVHVAERPPPSQRLPSSETSGSNGNPVSERRVRGRAGAGGMRNSPLFRALDGMVVGTMAFPVNASTNGQTPVNPLAASSSFCMNRITVARHMLDCANNIAAFLEDPSRGLNNQPLDILARGRWTMESTVVEVGITSDIPQSQQIVEMVQGAVQAALRRNGNTNVTLVQLPTVYRPSEGGANSATSAAAAANANGTDASATPVGQDTVAASVAIEDVIDEDEDDDTPTNEQNTDNNTSNTPSATADMEADGAGGSSSANEEVNTDQSRRRTGTRVLGRVIEQLRNVQNRLNPFVVQYHELLQNEPTFEEDDITGRENAQRLFDRVSEAFHYMSHAQHAISDLMLDVAQPSPRFLTCRPILVEQSGYVSSNNFITPAILPAALRQQQQSSRSSSTTTGTPNNATNTTSPATSTDTSGLTNSTTASASINSSTASSTNDANNSTVDDPIDDPVVWPPTINFGLPFEGDSNTDNAANNTATSRVPAQGGTLEIVLQPTPAYYLERNLQRQVARLLQDVVSAAPFDTEFHVHINSPNVVSIDVPIGGSTLAAAAAAAGNNRSTATSGAANNAANTDNSSTSPEATTPPTNDSPTTTASASTPSNANPARVTTATLPTTSTQTRSTARPQVHIGNIPVLSMPSGWNGRALPNNNVSSFDRFLPCNSRHVRDHEVAAGGATNTNGTGNSNQANPAPARPRPTRVGANMIDPRSANSASSSRTRQAPAFNFSSQSSTTPPPQDAQFTAFRSLLERSSMNPGFSSSSPTTTNAFPESRRLKIHSQLLNFIKNHIFEGKPINDENMPPAINRAIQWFGESLIYLPQYEKPEYDSRDSLFNILRNTLPLFIRFMNRCPMNLIEFEQKLKDICEQFRQRVYSVLYVCIGRANAELYWSQLMRLLCVSIRSNLGNEVVEFLTVYLNTNIPNGTDEADAQQFIVYRNSSNSSNSVEMPMVDTDVEMTEVAGTSQPEVDDEPLPPVVPGSAAWHSNFPNDWLPIITRDIQRQTENTPNQPPYSDAYISGMSSKRRKLIQHSKPPTEISALIADSVSKAIHNVGVGTSTSSNQTQTPDEIARVIANDATVQSSCTEAVRVNVRDRLKKDSDYEPEKFPKSTKFIQK